MSAGRSSCTQLDDGFLFPPQDVGHRHPGASRDPCAAHARRLDSGFRRNDEIHAASIWKRHASVATGRAGCTGTEPVSGHKKGALSKAPVAGAAWSISG